MNVQWGLVAIAGAVLGVLGGVGVALAEPFGGEGKGGATTTAATMTLVDVVSCPGAAGALGQVRRGAPVLVTAVGPDEEYLEVNFPISPNGRGWVPASQVELAGDVTTLPTKNCSPMFPSGLAAAGTAAVTATATATAIPTAIPTASASPSAPTNPSPGATSTAVGAPPAGPSPTSMPQPAPTPPVTPAPAPPAITASATAPPPVPTAPTPTPTATPDLVAPVISQASVTPTQVNRSQPGPNCPNRPTVVLVGANVVDAGGVKAVFVRFTGKDTGGLDQRVLLPTQGTRYEASIGPFSVNANTTITFTVFAHDATGNERQVQAGTVTVYAC